MKWWWKVCVIGGFLWAWLLGMPSVARAAQTPLIRALLPQPSTGQPEWILLQNSTGGLATQSAVLKDTHGSVKSYSFVLAADQEWYQLTASVSGITLNNDQDGVTLSVQGALVDSSQPYETSFRDQVWTRLDSGWQWLSLSDFNSRWEELDWSDPVMASPSATPTPVVTVKKTPTPAPSLVQKVVQTPTGATSSAQMSVATSPTPYPGKKIILAVTKTEELQSSDPSVPAFQEPDYALELASYRSWLQWWWRATWLWLASFLCWASFGVPWVLQKIRKRSTRRWGWSLLS